MSTYKYIFISKHFSTPYCALRASHFRASHFVLGFAKKKTKKTPRLIYPRAGEVDFIYTQSKFIYIS